MIGTMAYSKKVLVNELLALYSDEIPAVSRDAMIEQYFERYRDHFKLQQHCIEFVQEYQQSTVPPASSKLDVELIASIFDEETSEKWFTHLNNVMQQGALVRYFWKHQPPQNGLSVDYDTTLINHFFHAYKLYNAFFQLFYAPSLEKTILSLLEKNDCQNHHSIEWALANSDQLDVHTQKTIEHYRSLKEQGPAYSKKAFAHFEIACHLKEHILSILPQVEAFFSRHAVLTQNPSYDTKDIELFYVKRGHDASFVKTVNALHTDFCLAKCNMSLNNRLFARYVGEKEQPHLESARQAHHFCLLTQAQLYKRLEALQTPNSQLSEPYRQMVTHYKRFEQEINLLNNHIEGMQAYCETEIVPTHAPDIMHSIDTLLANEQKQQVVGNPIQTARAQTIFTIIKRTIEKLVEEPKLTFENLNNQIRLLLTLQRDLTPFSEIRHHHTKLAEQFVQLLHVLLEKPLDGNTTQASIIKNKLGRLSQYYLQIAKQDKPLCLNPNVTQWSHELHRLFELQKDPTRNILIDLFLKTHYQELQDPQTRSQLIYELEQNIKTPVFHGHVVKGVEPEKEICAALSSPPYKIYRNTCWENLNTRWFILNDLKLDFENNNLPSSRVGEIFHLYQDMSEELHRLAYLFYPTFVEKRILDLQKELAPEVGLSTMPLNFQGAFIVGTQGFSPDKPLMRGRSIELMMLLHHYHRISEAGFKKPQFPNPDTINEIIMQEYRSDFMLAYYKKFEYFAQKISQFELLLQTHCDKIDPVPFEILSSRNHLYQCLIHLQGGDMEQYQKEVLILNHSRKRLISLRDNSNNAEQKRAIEQHYEFLQTYVPILIEKNCGDFLSFKDATNKQAYTFYRQKVLACSTELTTRDYDISQLDKQEPEELLGKLKQKHADFTNNPSDEFEAYLAFLAEMQKHIFTLPLDVDHSALLNALIIAFQAICEQCTDKDYLSWHLLNESVNAHCTLLEKEKSRSHDKHHHLRYHEITEPCPTIAPEYEFAANSKPVIRKQVYYQDRTDPRTAAKREQLQAKIAKRKQNTTPCSQPDSIQALNTQMEQMSLDQKDEPAKIVKPQKKKKQKSKAKHSTKDSQPKGNKHTIAPLTCSETEHLEENTIPERDISPSEKPPAVATSTIEQEQEPTSAVLSELVLPGITIASTTSIAINDSTKVSLLPKNTPNLATNSANSAHSIKSPFVAPETQPSLTWSAIASRNMGASLRNTQQKAKNPPTKQCSEQGSAQPADISPVVAEVAPSHTVPPMPTMATTKRRKQKRKKSTPSNQKPKQFYAIEEPGIQPDSQSITPSASDEIASLDENAEASSQPFQANHDPSMGKPLISKTKHLDFSMATQSFVCEYYPKIAIDKEYIDALAPLLNAGYHVIVKGGKVRDTILDLSSSDVDVLTDCPSPQRYLKNCSCIIIGNKRHYLLQGLSLPVEIYADQDFSQPKDAIYAQALKADIGMNSLFVNIENGDVLDPLHRFGDFYKTHLDIIGPPRVRFEQDPHIILRMLRQAMHVTKRIEGSTWLHIQDPTLKQRIKQLPFGVIKKEIRAFFLRGQACANFDMLYRTGMLECLFPFMNYQNNYSAFFAFCQSLDSLPYRQRQQTDPLGVLFEMLNPSLALQFDSEAAAKVLLSHYVIDPEEQTVLLNKINTVYPQPKSFNASAKAFTPSYIQTQTSLDRGNPTDLIDRLEQQAERLLRKG